MTVSVHNPDRLHVQFKREAFVDSALPSIALSVSARDALGGGAAGDLQDPMVRPLGQEAKLEHA